MQQGSKLSDQGKVFAEVRQQLDDEMDLANLGVGDLDKELREAAAEGFQSFTDCSDRAYRELLPLGLQTLQADQQQQQASQPKLQRGKTDVGRANWEAAEQSGSGTLRAGGEVGGNPQSGSGADAAPRNGGDVPPTEGEVKKAEQDAKDRELETLKQKEENRRKDEQDAKERQHKEEQAAKEKALRKELDSLHVSSMTSLVKEVMLPGGDKKTVLWMTNPQVKLFEWSNIDTLTNALRINNPQLVIQIFSSLSATDKAAHIALGTHHSLYQKTYHAFGQKSYADLQYIDRCITDFLQHCVLDLAEETDALVLLNNSDCVISNALSQLCEARSRAWGLRCSVVTFACTHYILRSMLQKGTMANSVANVHPEWKKRVEASRELDDLKHPGTGWSDLPRGCTHYILVDSLEDPKDKSNFMVSKHLEDFRRIFVQKMTEKLPAFAIAALRGSNAKVADHVNRELPVLLLDTEPFHLQRPRKGDLDTCFRRACRKFLKENHELIRKGTYSPYSRSFLAVMHMYISELQRVMEDRALARKRGDQDKEVNYIYQKIREVERRNRELKDGLSVHPDEDDIQAAPSLPVAPGDGPGSPADGQGRPEKLDRYLSVGLPLQMRGQKVPSAEDLPLRDLTRCVLGFWETLEREQNIIRALWVILQLLEHRSKLEETNEQTLQDWLARCSVDWELPFGGLYPYSEGKQKVVVRLAESQAEFVEMVKLFAKNTGDKVVICNVLRLKPNVDATQAKKAKVAFAKELENLIQKARESLLKVAQHHGLAPEEYRAMTTLLESPVVFSSRLNEKNEDMKKTIERMWRKSRVPTVMRQGSLYTLRQAWEVVDVFNSHSDWYKRVAKLAYRALIVTSALISMVTVVSLNRPDLISQEVLRVSIIVLSSIGSLIVGLTTIFAPEKRWLGLRAAAFMLESEIWKFRVSFWIDVKKSHAPHEEDLREFIRTTVAQVTATTGMSRTALNSDFKIIEVGRGDYVQERFSSVYKHGQYADPPPLAPSFWKRCCPCCSRAPRATLGHYSRSITPPRRSCGCCCRRSTQIMAADDRLVKETEVELDSDLFDDHHSPLEPDQYLTFRVKPVIDFYTRRMSPYYWLYLLWEILLLLGSVATMLMSAFDLASWSAAVTAATNVIMAWRSFHSTDNKLTRYSNTIEKVRTVESWWRQLNKVQKCSATSIQNLVELCEEAFRAELDGWSSTSSKLSRMAAEMRKKVASDTGPPKHEKVA